MKFVCITKFTHSRGDTMTQIYWTRLTLLTYNLPFKCHFNTIYHNVLLNLASRFSLDYNCALLYTIGESCIVFHSTYTKSS